MLYLQVNVVKEDVATVDLLSLLTVAIVDALEDLGLPEIERYCVSFAIK